MKINEILPTIAAATRMANEPAEGVSSHCADQSGSPDLCLFCNGTGTEHYDLLLSERTLCDHCEGTGHENSREDS